LITLVETAVRCKRIKTRINFKHRLLNNNSQIPRSIKQNSSILSRQLSSCSW